MIQSFRSISLRKRARLTVSSLFPSPGKTRTFFVFLSEKVRVRRGFGGNDFAPPKQNGQPTLSVLVSEETWLYTLGSITTIHEKNQVQAG